MSLARIRITTFASMLIATAGSCGTSKADVRAAMNSGYDTGFAHVYDAALSTVRKYYPKIAVEDAVAGIVKTSWHPVRNLSAEDDARQSDRPMNMTDPIVATSGSTVRKIYFIRVQVYVVGGDPWRVRVDGQASEWASGGVPTPLYGANVPPWLAGRLNALRVEIHEQLKPYAVKLESTAVTEAPEEPEPEVQVDQSHLGALPPDALAVVVNATSAARSRDLDALKAVMHPRFEWSPGAPRSADQALMMWRADSTLLDALVATIEAGCALEPGETRVTCPDPPTAGTHLATFERGEDGTWKMTAFVSRE